MTFSWNHALLDQLAFAWDAQFLPRMAGLSDAAYLWEPVPGGWSVRPDGEGSWKADWAEPEPEPPPFTTIAWRLAHIATFFGERASNHFGDGSFDPATVAWTGSADDALRRSSARNTRAGAMACAGWARRGYFGPVAPPRGRTLTSRS